MRRNAQKLQKMRRKEAIAELATMRQSALDLRSERDDLRKDEHDLLVRYRREKRRLEREVLSRSTKLDRLGHDLYRVTVCIEQAEGGLHTTYEKIDKLLEKLKET